MEMTEFVNIDLDRLTPRPTDDDYPDEGEDEDYDAPAMPAPVDLLDDAALERASQQNCIAWLGAYRKLMAETIEKIRMLLKSKDWVPIEPHEGSRVRLYERGKVRHNYITLKAHAVLEGIRADRLNHVILDHEERSRLRWDSHYTMQVEQVETFKAPEGDLHIVKSLINMRAPRFSPRFLMGILWSNFDGTTNTYEIVFHTTTHHRLFTCPSDAVPVRGLMGAYIRVLQEPAASELILISHVNPGGHFDKLPGLIVAQFKERLRTRVTTYEEAAKNFRNYYWDQYPILRQ